MDTKTNLQNLAVSLSHREKEVLILVSEGKNSREIGDMLYISERTVEFHMRQVRSKLLVKSSIHAFRRALECGILSV
jgi:DNA-binding CsgD family transcriptional regulator